MIKDFFFNNNWEYVSWMAETIGVVLTFTLTLIIIKQTKKLSVMQSNLEKKLNEGQMLLQKKSIEEQLLLQKRQIRVNLFPYKREIYLNLFKIFELTSFLEGKIYKLDLVNKPAHNVNKIFNTALKKVVGDQRKIFVSLMEAEYILPSNISSTVLEINKIFDSMCSKLVFLGSFVNVLTPEEIDEIKNHNLPQILEECKRINSKISFIQSLLPRELDISILDN